MSYLTEAKEMLREIEREMRLTYADNKQEQTIRALAVELAARFYYDDKMPNSPNTQQRSAAFRRAFPALRDFMRGREHQTDGSVLHRVPAWRYFTELARKMLSNMLGRSDVSEAMKERIYDAICEDREKEYKMGGKKLTGTMH
jgi:hypothetical protein